MDLTSLIIMEWLIWILLLTEQSPYQGMSCMESAPRTKCWSYPCRCSTMKPTSGSVHSLPSAGFGSCAVPPGPNITLLPHPPAPVPQDLGWVDPSKPFDNFTQQQQQHFVRYHHQEQCPHYNNRWSVHQALCLTLDLVVSEVSVNGISKISCDCQY